MSRQPQSSRLTNDTLSAVAGVSYVFHVYSGSLAHRLKTNTNIPVIAVRCSSDDFKTMRLYRRVECLGPSEVVEMFDRPLPGTNNRGVAVCTTSYPLRVFYPVGQPAKPIKVTDDRTPDEILADVLREYQL